MFVDVSHWQGEMDWEAAKNAGVTHAYIKASEGLYKDPRFEENWVKAKAAGIKRGAYHYFLNSVDWYAQAQFFHGVVGDDQGELEPALDVEDTGGVVRPGPILSWLRAVELAWGGIKPIIYTAWWFWDDYLDGTEWAKEYKLWVMSYTNGTEPWRIPKDWNGEYHLWQYTSTARGRDYGARSTYIDLNRYAV